MTCLYLIVVVFIFSTGSDERDLHGGLLMTHNFQVPVRDVMFAGLSACLLSAFCLAALMQPAHTTTRGIYSPMDMSHTFCIMVVYLVDDITCNLQ